MQRINEDIKNKTFASIYLFYGDETYLKRFYKNKIREGILDIEDTFNYSYFEGKSIDIVKLIEIADTMPFFKEKRLIIVENSGLFKGDKKEQSAKLANYLKDTPETTHILFIEEEVDKRSKLFKEVKNIGYPVQLMPPDEKSLMKWAYLILKKDNKKITEDNLLFLLNRVGTDMDTIEKEMEKLLSYTWGKEVIEKEDIIAVCTVEIHNKIFEMIQFIGEKQQQKALDIYNDLLVLKEPPLKILALLVRQFNLLLQVKQMQVKGFSAQSISQQIGLHKFVIEKCIQQGRNYTERLLLEALTDAIETESRIKTGLIDDLVGIELIILKYSSK